MICDKFSEDCEEDGYTRRLGAAYEPDSSQGELLGSPGGKVSPYLYHDCLRTWLETWTTL